jgi:hypothetical protein
MKALKEIGYSFSLDDLETFEADCFTIISNELVRLESKEAKKGFK